MSAGSAGPPFRIETFAVLDSTSTELKRRAGDGAAGIDGVVVVADTQSAGRGRHGRTWIDQPGGSLLFSVGWRAPVGAAKLAGLSLAAGVAIAQALEHEGVAPVQLKWPNDLLFRHCKLGGILIEAVNAQSDRVDVIIGVGINLKIDHALREAIPAAVIDLEDAGWRGERAQLLARILSELGAVFERFARDGFAPFRAAWVARHALQQRNVTIWRAGREVAAGKAVDVDDDGALLLRTPTGVRRFTSGESTLRAG